MIIQYLGQSAFYLEWNGVKFIVDPMITGNSLAKDIDVNSLQCDYILLTHGHADHTLDAEAIANHNKAKIISNYEVVTWFENKGIKGHPMNLGGKFSFDFGTLKYVHAVHSSMLPDGSYGGASGGFVCWGHNEKTFYIAGDTALTFDMKLIPMTCPPLDFAILPIGDNFTMGIEDAIIAAEFINCKKIIGCHFDTFGYIKIDHQAAIQAFADKGIELILLSIGQKIEL